MQVNQKVMCISYFIISLLKIKHYVQPIIIDCFSTMATVRLTTIFNIYIIQCIRPSELLFITGTGDFYHHGLYSCVCSISGIITAEFYLKLYSFAAILN